MKWTLRILGALAVVIVLVFILALTLPARTQYTRVITLKQTPEAIFAVLADVEKMPEWSRNVTKVELLPPIDDKEATRQTFKGGMTMTIVTTESLAPTHLVRKMRKDQGRFEGSWTYEITPTSDGSKVALTEKSRAKNPFFRLAVRFFGPTKYIDEHLVDLARHFSEDAKPESVQAHTDRST